MTDLKYFKRVKAPDEELGTRVIQVKTDDIRPNRAQPRAEFEQNSIKLRFLKFVITTSKPT